VTRWVNSSTSSLQVATASAGKIINDASLYEGLPENTQEMEVLLKELKEMAAEYRKKGIKVKLK
jgi:hypothetical protein